MLTKFANLEGCIGMCPKDACRFDRRRKMLKDKPILAIRGVDTTEKVPKVDV